VTRFQEFFLSQIPSQPKPDNKVGVEQDLSRTVLYYVCSCGKVEFARLLLSCNDIDANKTNNDGEGPLHIACENGYSLVVEQLLLNVDDIDVNLVLLFDRLTPLHVAASIGRTDVVTRFLACTQADPTFVDAHGYMPIQLAAQQGQADVVKLLAAVTMCLRATIVYR
jgi:ankyrin repeat protein